MNPNTSPSKYLHYAYMSCNPNLTPEFVEQHISMGWSWVNMSTNKFDKYFDIYKYNDCYLKFPFIIKKHNSYITILEYKLPYDIARLIVVEYVRYF